MFTINVTTWNNIELKQNCWCMLSLWHQSNKQKKQWLFYQSKSPTQFNHWSVSNMHTLHLVFFYENAEAVGGASVLLDAISNCWKSWDVRWKRGGKFRRWTGVFFWSPDVDLSGFQTVRYGESRLFSKKEVVVHSANYQRVIESPHFSIFFLQTCWLGT